MDDSIFASTLFPSARFNLISIGIALFVAVLVLGLIKNRKVEFNHAIIWVAVSCGFVVLTIFPGILVRISKIFGIELPVNALFLFGILFIILFLLGVTIGMSRHSLKVRRLIQMQAILQIEIDELRMIVEKSQQEPKQYHGES